MEMTVEPLTVGFWNGADRWTKGEICPVGFFKVYSSSKSSSSNNKNNDEDDGMAAMSNSIFDFA